MEGSRIINHPFTSSLFCVSQTLLFFSHIDARINGRNLRPLFRCSDDNSAVFLIKFARRRSNQFFIHTLFASYMNDEN